MNIAEHSPAVVLGASATPGFVSLLRTPDIELIILGLQYAELILRECGERVSLDEKEAITDIVLSAYRSSKKKRIHIHSHMDTHIYICQFLLRDIVSLSPDTILCGILSRAFSWIYLCLSVFLAVCLSLSLAITCARVGCGSACIR